MSTILITGGTGLIGKKLSKLLTEKGHEVIIVSRGESKAAVNSPTGSGKQASSGKQADAPSVAVAHWDTEKQVIDKAAIEKADYIINLAGAGVADKRWSKKRKQEIIDSRVKSGELIVKALKETPNKVKAVISASAIGWYGDDEKRKASKKAFTEDDPVDSDYLGQVVKVWEESVEPVTALGKRLVKLRLGIVLSADGGALKEFMTPVKFGVATILGSGKQLISWIHIEDAARLFIYAIEHEELSGVYNAVAAQAVTNKTFNTLLADKLKGKFHIPLYVPSFVLKIVLGEMSVEVLKSATVSNTKVSNAGFQFLYPTIDTALTNLVKS